jgi:hypothetical protein
MITRTTPEYSAYYLLVASLLHVHFSISPDGPHSKDHLVRVPFSFDIDWIDIHKFLLVILHSLLRVMGVSIKMRQGYSLHKYDEPAGRVSRYFKSSTVTSLGFPRSTKKLNGRILRCSSLCSP